MKRLQAFKTSNLKQAGQTSEKLRQNVNALKGKKQEFILVKKDEFQGLLQDEKHFEFQFKVMETFGLGST